MTTKINILGWKVEGLRCPDHEISCTTANGNKPAHVVLVQMPNGTGKTTTLRLIKAALSGEAEHWDTHQVKELKKRDSQADEGVFEIRLQIDRSYKLTIRMMFDFSTGVVEYKTTNEKAGGQTAGFDPPQELKRLLHKDFVPFFVFDGELAQTLLDKSQTKSETALVNLFQLHYLPKMKKKVSDYYKAFKTDNNITAEEQRGYTRRLNEVNDLEDLIKERKAEQKRLIEQRNSLQAEINELNTSYAAEISKNESLEEQLRGVREKLHALEEEIINSEQQAMTHMTYPNALSPAFESQLYEFKQQLDIAKLPEKVAR